MSRIVAACGPFVPAVTSDEDDGRDQPADVRDEPAQEDEHGERRRERDAEDHQEQEFDGGHHRRQDRHPAEVPADPLEGPVAARLDLARDPGRSSSRASRPMRLFPSLSRKKTRKIDRITIVTTLRDGAGDLVDVGLRPALDLRDGLVDGVDRLGRQAGGGNRRLRLGDPARDPLDHLVDVRSERKRDQDEDPAKDEDGAPRDGGRRQGIRPSASPKGEDERREGCRDDEGDDDRGADERDRERDRCEHGPERDHDQDTPADGPESPEPRLGRPKSLPGARSVRRPLRPSPSAYCADGFTWRPSRDQPNTRAHIDVPVRSRHNSSS